jgi:hypothetical protein
MKLNIKVARRWWVMPLVSSAAYFLWACGKDQIPDRFVIWIVNHGFRYDIE